MAAVLALQTPFAEMLAVVAQHTIPVLTDPGTGSTDHLRAFEVNQLARPDPGATSTGEVSERNLFHRSPEQVMAEATVVNDLTVADVDAVMGKAESRSDKV
jgi:hypothetical protein